MIVKPLSTFTKDKTIYIANIGNIQSDHLMNEYEWLNFVIPTETVVTSEKIIFSLPNFKPEEKGFVGGTLIFETSNRFLYTIDVVDSGDITKPNVTYNTSLLISDNLDDIIVRFEIELVKLFEKLKSPHSGSFMALKQKLRETDNIYSRLYPEKLI